MIPPDRYVVHAPHLTRLGSNPPAINGEPEVIARPVRPPITADKGRERWAELHRRSLAWAGGDDSGWLAAFAERLPCGECRGHWLGMVARTPPDWANYFRWGVERHNEVNRRLGKPELTEAAARSLWHEPGDEVSAALQGA